MGAEGLVRVAIKVLAGSSSANPAELLREAAFVSQLSHQNVVSAVGVVTSDKPLCLLFEWCPGGTLRDSLRDGLDEAPVGGPKSEPLLKYCLGIARGMVYLRSLNIVHRQLSCATVLLDAEWSPKVAGLEQCRVMQPDGDGVILMSYRNDEPNLKFAIPWLSPEVLTRHAFSEFSDVFSFGITCIEVFSGGEAPYFPFADATVAKMVKTGYQHPIPERCPNDVYSGLILCCLKAEPADRPSFEQIVPRIGSLLGFLKSGLLNSMDTPESDLSFDSFAASRGDQSRSRSLGAISGSGSFGSGSFSAQDSFGSFGSLGSTSDGGASSRSDSAGTSGLGSFSSSLSDGFSPPTLSSGTTTTPEHRPAEQSALSQSQQRPRLVRRSPSFVVEASVKDGAVVQVAPNDPTTVGDRVKLIAKDALANELRRQTKIRVSKSMSRRATQSKLQDKLIQQQSNALAEEIVSDEEPSAPNKQWTAFHNHQDSGAAFPEQR